MPAAGGACPPPKLPPHGAPRASQPQPFPGSLTRFYQGKSVSQRVLRREGAGKEEEGTREKMVRSEVRVTERGRAGPQEHTLLRRNSPLCICWATSSGVPRRGGCVWGVQTRAGVSGGLCSPTSRGGGRTQRKRYRGTKREAGRGSCIPELPLSSPRGRWGWSKAGRGGATSLCPTPRSLDRTPAGNDPKHCHVLIFLT